MNPSSTIDPVREWLSAYHDGALRGERLAWVADHLATCPGCQAELAALESLSRLLQADPVPLPAASLAAGSPQRFAARVVRQLPPPRPDRWARLLDLGLRQAPLLLFAGWAFVQAVLLVAGALLAGQRALPGARLALAPLLPPTEAVSFVWLALLELALLALFAGLFAAWLSAYWSHSRARAWQEGS
jgi:anti-sigma factor RsiW